MIKGMSYHLDTDEHKTINNALRVYLGTLQKDIDALGEGIKGTKGDISEWYKGKMEELMGEWEETYSLLKRFKEPEFTNTEGKVDPYEMVRESLKGVP